MIFTDSHAHLFSSSVEEEVDAILARAKTANVQTIVNICTDAEGITKSRDLVQTHPWVYHAAAVHPHDAEKDGEHFFPIVEQYARQGHLVAIGETGLDYHYHHSSIDSQQHFLRLHLQLAATCHLPVVIHCREAFSDFFCILDQQPVPGVLHCFTGTLEDAHKVIERGWYLSLSGIVTFKKSEELREVARVIPLDNLLIETDAPYLAPQSKRGKTNEPAYLPETAAVIAAVRGISIAELAQATTQNARNLFAIT